MLHLLSAILAAASVALAGVQAQAAPAAEAILYVGTYTQESSKGSYAWRFDEATGALKPLGLAAEAEQPAHL